MTIIDTTTVSALIVLVALAVLASVVTLGMVLRVYLANRSVRSAVAFQRDLTTATAVRRTAAVAALILGIQVIAACGTEKAASDTVDPGAAIVKVQGFVGSADAVERRAATALGGKWHGSADALERRLAVEHSGACLHLRRARPGC